MSETSPSQYKYLDYDGAEKTLLGCSLKLSSPAAFNDPFDMNIEAALGADADEYEKKLHAEHVDFLAGEIDQAQLRENGLKNMIVLMSDAFRNATPEKRENLKRMVVEGLNEHPDPATLERHGKEIVDKLSSDFLNWGIFCVTKKKNSLLMWAHYADKHKGAIFEFAPNIPKDSVLRIAKPVKYQRERPLVYRNPSDYIRSNHLMTTEEAANQIISNLIYTKSIEWEYEEEYRVAVPDFVPANKNFELLRFHRDELVSICFGCRMLNEQKVRLSMLAKIINPTVKLYQTVRDKRDYTLRWQTIEN